MIVFFLIIKLKFNDKKKAPFQIRCFLLISKSFIYLLELEFLFSLGEEFLGFCSLFCLTRGVPDSD